MGWSLEKLFQEAQLVVPHFPPIELRNEGFSSLKNEDVMAGVPAAIWEAKRMRAIPRD